MDIQKMQPIHQTLTSYWKEKRKKSSLSVVPLPFQNQGTSPGLKEEWEYIEDPITHVKTTKGLSKEEIKGTDATMDSMKEKTKEVSERRVKEVKEANPEGETAWNKY